MINQAQDWEYTPVPQSAVRLFRMCWQLEQWLRTIVYVELRAARVDWEAPIEKQAKISFDNDKQQHHMSTPHQSALSYLTFGQLWKIISSDENWPLFSAYFPPKENVEARIDEVKTIRNRVAHFREPHLYDIARLELFLRDMEPGIRKFCSRYRTGRMPDNFSGDPVYRYLEERWEQIGWGIELLGTHGWLYAAGSSRMHPTMNARLQMLVGENYSPDLLSGIIYRLTVTSSRRCDNAVDAGAIFNKTKKLHGRIIHLFLSVGDELSITIPAVLGTEEVGELIANFLEKSLDTSGFLRQPLDREKLNWPEYVLWPDHMLTMFIEEINEPILQIPTE